MLVVILVFFCGSSDFLSDKPQKNIDKKKKAAEPIVYLNNHKQIYNNEQQ